MQRPERLTPMRVFEFSTYPCQTLSAALFQADRRAKSFFHRSGTILLLMALIGTFDVKHNVSGNKD
jgi:hypothetical protein